MTVDAISRLHQALRQHQDIATAIAEVLAAVEQDHVAALRVAVAVYDAGRDPGGVELEAALTAALEEDRRG